MDEFKQLQLQQLLLSLGKLVALNKQMFVVPSIINKQILSFEKHFKPYNPRKPGYNRYGLSMTSHDGGFSGIPDLDSLKEYNKENNTTWYERDFQKWTPFFKNCKELRELMLPFHQNIWRSHIIRLNKGGFFPFHRDSIALIPNSFRLIISLSSLDDFVLLIENERIFLEPGKLYFMNTQLVHSLFSYQDKSDLVVFNIELCENSIRTLINNLACK